jgi:DNA-binding beta-propeller fold protein YncE
VLRLSPQGAVTLAAGGGDTAHGDQADAKLALLNHPAGAAVDAAGNLYIADRDNNRIRRVSPAGIITTVAGTGTPGNTGDGLRATLATLNAPSAVTVDSTGVVYITDTGNHRIRKIALDGTMFAVLGTGLQSPVYTLPGPIGDLYISDTGLGAILHWSGGILTTVKSGLQGPRGLALDAQGNLYFTEMDAARVSRLAPDGTMVQLAQGFWNIPRGVAVTSSGAVVVADTGLQQIVQVDSPGHASVVAGTGSPGFSGDGGPAASAQLGFPWDLAAGAGGVLYFADLDNNRIRALTPAPQATLAQVSLYDIVNAASLLPGPIAPGMLVAIRGTGLTAAQLPTVQVLFGSIAGTILSVNNTQLLVQVPPQLSTGTVNIDVQLSGASLGGGGGGI